jgi:hypothetical protein
MLSIASTAKEPVIQVLYSGRLPENKMKEAYNARVLRESVYWARCEGDRIVANGEIIWPGTENRTGCLVAESLANEQWKTGGERFIQHLEALPAGSTINIQTYREGGRWVTIKSHTLL